MEKSNNELDSRCNIYRTKNYIVKQILSLKTSNNFENKIFSCDYYYRRTKARDRDYELDFNKRINLNGKRVHTSSFVKYYCD